MDLKEMRLDWRMRLRVIWWVARGRPVAYRLHSRNVELGWHGHLMELMVADCVIEHTQDGASSVVLPRHRSSPRSRWVIR